MYAVKAALDREGVAPPLGGKFWSLKYIRHRINATSFTGPTPSRKFRPWSRLMWPLGSTPPRAR